MKNALLIIVHFILLGQFLTEIHVMCNFLNAKRAVAAEQRHILFAEFLKEFLAILSQFLTHIKGVNFHYFLFYVDHNAILSHP